MGDANEILLRKLLAGKNNNKVIKPGLMDGGNRLFVRLLMQVDPANLGSDVLRQRQHIEPRSCCEGHGASSHRFHLPPGLAVPCFAACQSRENFFHQLAR